MAEVHPIIFQSFTLCNDLETQDTGAIEVVLNMRAERDAGAISGRQGDWQLAANYQVQCIQ